MKVHLFLLDNLRVNRKLYFSDRIQAMCERTMYETIMDLPLFKGIGKDEVSAFVEKTKLHFGKYSSGEMIAERGENVSSLKFIISGNCRLSYRSQCGRISITAELRSGFVIGASNLFGISTRYPFDAEASGEVGIMEFSKERYIDILLSNKIYLLNFANYLSIQAQRQTDNILVMKDSGFVRILAEWISLFTSRNVSEIDIEWNPDESLEDIMGIATNADIDMLTSAGIIDNSPGKIRILDTERLLLLAIGKE